MKHTIKIIIIILAGSLCSPSLTMPATWAILPISVPKAPAVSIDLDSLKIEGDNISYWLKLKYTQPQTMLGVACKTALAYMQTDCKEKTSGETREVLYDEKGTAIFQQDYVLDMKPPIPDTLGGSLLNFLCKYRDTLKELSEGLSKFPEKKKIGQDLGIIEK